MSINLEVIKEKANKILYEIFKEDYSEDPFGFSFLLYFLLKQELIFDKLDDLMEWSEFWVEKIFKKKELTKFSDIEITSAIFFLKLLYLYKDYSMEDIEIVELLESYFDDHEGFFDNLLYTIIIIGCISNSNNLKIDADKYKGWLYQKIISLKDKLFNDFKIFIVLFMFFSDDNQYYSIFSFIYEKIFNRITYKVGNIYDLLYHIWFLINFSNKFKLSKIDKQVFDRANKVINNFDIYFNIYEDFYELDVIPESKNISKINFAVFLDLFEEYYKNNVSISKDEYNDLKFKENVIFFFQQFFDITEEINNIFQSKFGIPFFNVFDQKLVSDLTKEVKDKDTFEKAINSLANIIDSIKIEEINRLNLVKFNLNKWKEILHTFFNERLSSKAITYNQTYVENLRRFKLLRNKKIHKNEIKFVKVLKQFNYDYPPPWISFWIQILDTLIESLKNINIYLKQI